MSLRGTLCALTLPVLLNPRLEAQAPALVAIDPPPEFQAYVPVTVDPGKDRQARVRVKVKGPKTEIELPLMPEKPRDVKFNDLEGVLANVKTTGWEE